MIASPLLLACRPGPPISTPDAALEIPREGPLARSAIRIGTSGDYPPFSEWSADAVEPSGFSVEVARAWAGQSGLRVEWHRFSWKGLERDLAAGRFDMALSGVTVRPDRSIQGRFSLPLTLSGAVALVAEGSELATPADLDQPDRRIAVNAGGHLERAARALFPRAEILPVEKNRDVLGRLGRDGVDVVISDTLEAPLWQARHGGLQPVGPLTRDRKAAWFSPANTRLIRQFDRWLLRAEADGTLARLREGYGLPDVATAAPRAALIASLDERLSLMAEVAESKRIRGVPIEDRAREGRVLEAALRSVRVEADRQGAEPLRPEAVRRLYRAQIEAAKWIQRDQWAKTGTAATTSSASEAERIEAERRLDEQIRPALLFLGDRIAALLVAATQAAAESPNQAQDLARELARHRLPEDHLRELYAALVEVGVR